jgi:hypothetical protein
MSKFMYAKWLPEVTIAHFIYRGPDYAILGGADRVGASFDMLTDYDCAQHCRKNPVLGIRG